MTSNIHSSHDLNRPEAKRFRVKLANLNIPKTDLVEVFLDLLEAANLKAKNLADDLDAPGFHLFRNTDTSPHFALTPKL